MARRESEPGGSGVGTTPHWKKMEQRIVSGAPQRHREGKLCQGRGHLSWFHCISSFQDSTWDTTGDASIFVKLMMHVCSAVSDSETLWTVAHQDLPFMGFSRQEYWSGLPRPPPGDLPNPGIEPTSPVAPALAGRFFTTEPPGKPLKLN